jgi:nucleoid-associated protein YgaU
MNLMAGLSAALFVICFVMGAGLIQNRNRISDMQGQLTQLNTAYRNLFVQRSSDGTAQVFAAQPDSGEPAALRSETAKPPAAQPGLNELSTAQPDFREPEAPPNTDESGMSSDLPAESAVNTAPPNDYAPIVETGPNTSEENSPSSGTDTDGAISTVPDIPDEVLVVDDLTPEEETLPEAYTIQPGDSLIEISLRFYGDTSMMDEILALNGITNADKIVSGKTIALPRP